jgi:hypothetical protein
MVVSKGNDSMKHICCIISFWIFGLLQATPQTVGQSPTYEARTIAQAAWSLGSAEVRDLKVREIVRSIETMLAPIKGYTAEVESQSLDPNGGFDKFQDEQTVSCPVKMLVKRKVLTAHNADAVGDTATMIIDGNWLFTRTEEAPLTAEKKRIHEKMIMDAPGKLTPEER